MLSLPTTAGSLIKLERCRRSVVNQMVGEAHDVHQFMIADGEPQALVDAWDVTHVRIPAQRDCGDTPRIAGAMFANSAGYDAFSFLDADTWYEPGFIFEMTSALQSSKSNLVTCPRWLWRTDATRMAVDDESDGVHFNDTNCYLFRMETSFVLSAIAFKKDWHDFLIGDQLLQKEVINSDLNIGRVTNPLVNYETNNAWHYIRHNEQPPQGAKRLIVDQGDGRRYSCLEEDIVNRPDGSMYCPPERLMAPDGSRPYARRIS